MIKIIEPARNLPRELEEMRAAKDIWKWGFWIVSVALGVALVFLVR